MAPSVTSVTAEDLNVEQRHLTAIPVSFVLGYILPVILLSLPAPRLVSRKFKHTVSGWYQQWSLFVAFFHYAYLFLLRDDHALLPQQLVPSSSSTLASLRLIYSLAFVMAAVPHWIVGSISFTAGLRPSMFNEKEAKALSPWKILVPTLPFKPRKARDISQGFLWLIQWDYLVGTVGMIVWALVLHSNARNVYRPDDKWTQTILRFAGYLILGGPGGLPVGIMWERDEWVFGPKA